MNLTSLSSDYSLLFRDPALRRLRRVGIVDVGSNSVRLVVFDGAARSPAYYFNEKVFCGLGAMLAKTGKLNPEGRVRALKAIKRFTLLAESLKLSTLTGVGTAAVREAVDGQEFLDEVQCATGLAVSIASGEEEARLAAQGVLVAWPEAEGIVCDLGGYSAEFAEMKAGSVYSCMTTSLGPLALLQVNSDSGDRRQYIEEILNSVGKQLGTGHSTLHLVGGSWRAMARLSMEHRQYPLEVISEYRMTAESVLGTLDWIRKTGFDKLSARNIVSSERLRHLPLAGEVLQVVLERLRPSEICVSANGIREGLLYEHMPERLRQRDPLIEACIYSERSSARQPGFGDKLFDFVQPLFKDAGRRRLRLARAACLLHDVTWRAHPSYRASISFDNATRANLGGLDHSGRVFLALALYHRYRNAGRDPSISKYLPLLSQSDARMAAILGKAMRFGAMFAVDSPDKIARLKFKSRKNKLILTLPASFQDIYGVVPDARFGSLARAMDCEPEVEVV